MAFKHVQNNNTVTKQERLTFLVYSVFFNAVSKSPPDLYSLIKYMWNTVNENADNEN